MKLGTEEKFAKLSPKKRQNTRNLSSRIYIKSPIIASMLGDSRLLWIFNDSKHLFDTNGVHINSQNTLSATPNASLTIGATGVNAKGALECTGPTSDLHNILPAPFTSSSQQFSCSQWHWEMMTSLGWCHNWLTHCLCEARASCTVHWKTKNGLVHWPSQCLHCLPCKC